MFTWRKPSAVTSNSNKPASPSRSTPTAPAEQPALLSRPAVSPTRPAVRPAAPTVAAPKPAQATAPAGAPAPHFATVIGPGMYYQGTLSGSGPIRIDGIFDGQIQSSGVIIITESAKVNANIQAGAVQVSGTVKGNITAQKVELLATGRVYGDLVTTNFESEEGAFLRGQLTMHDKLPH